eukprot:gene11590-4833_t
MTEEKEKIEAKTFDDEGWTTVMPRIKNNGNKTISQVRVKEIFSTKTFKGSITVEQNNVFRFYSGKITLSSKENLDAGKTYSCQLGEEKKDPTINISGLIKDSEKKFYSGCYVLFRHKLEFFFLINVNTSEFYEFKKKFYYWMNSSAMNKKKDLEIEEIKKIKEFIQNYKNVSKFSEEEIQYLKGEKSKDGKFGFSKKLKQMLPKDWTNYFNEYEKTENKPFYTCPGGKPEFYGIFKTLTEELKDEIKGCKTPLENIFKDLEITSNNSFELDQDGDRLISHYTVIDIDEFYKKLSANVKLSLNFLVQSF